MAPACVRCRCSNADSLRPYEYKVRLLCCAPALGNAAPFVRMLAAVIPFSLSSCHCMLPAVVRPSSSASALLSTWLPTQHSVLVRCWCWPQGAGSKTQGRDRLLALMFLRSTLDRRAKLALDAILEALRDEEKIKR